MTISNMRIFFPVLNNSWWFQQSANNNSAISAKVEL